MFACPYAHQALFVQASTEGLRIGFPNLVLRHSAIVPSLFGLRLAVMHLHKACQGLFKSITASVAGILRKTVAQNVLLQYLGEVLMFYALPLVCERSLRTAQERIETVYGDIAEFGGEGPETRRINAEGATAARRCQDVPREPQPEAKALRVGQTSSDQGRSQEERWFGSGWPDPTF